MDRAERWRDDPMRIDLIIRICSASELEHRWFGRVRSIFIPYSVPDQLTVVQFITSQNQLITTRIVIRSLFWNTLCCPANRRRWINVGSTFNHAQQTRYIETMLFLSWASVEDAGPALKQHCFSVSCLMGVNPHDAIKHHFASLKNDLIYWNLVVLEKKIHGTVLKINSIFFYLSPTSSHFHPLQVENCGRMKMTAVNSGLKMLKRWDICI